MCYIAICKVVVLCCIVTVLSTAACDESRARRQIGKCSQRNQHHDIWLPVLQDGKSKSEDWSDLFEHGEASAFRSQRSLQRNLCAPAQATQAAVWGNSDAYLQLMVGRDGNQRLKLVVLDCLNIFREIMRHPEWMDQFNLTFGPIFDAEGGRLIRPPSLGFWLGCIQKKLNSSRSLSKSLP